MTGIPAPDDTIDLATHVLAARPRCSVHADRVRPRVARLFDAVLSWWTQVWCAHVRVDPRPAYGLRPFGWVCRRCWAGFDTAPRRRWGWHTTARRQR